MCNVAYKCRNFIKEITRSFFSLSGSKCINELNCFTPPEEDNNYYEEIK